jgi:hypothetical protein
MRLLLSSDDAKILEMAHILNSIHRQLASLRACTVVLMLDHRICQTLVKPMKSSNRRSIKTFAWPRCKTKNKYQKQRLLSTKTRRVRRSRTNLTFRSSTSRNGQPATSCSGKRGNSSLRHNKQLDWRTWMMYYLRDLLQPVRLQDTRLWPKPIVCSTDGSGMSCLNDQNLIQVALLGRH